MTRLIRELYLTEWAVLLLLLDRMGVSGFWLGVAVAVAIVLLLSQVGGALSEAKRASIVDFERKRAPRSPRTDSANAPKE